ncbi:MAG: alanine racemase [Acidimicrobiales bacterium]|jgi:D-serine deaminase-like pyridoxal phosphate-dependent protein
MNLHDLDTPALVVDLNRVERNIDEMAQRALESGVRLRPHTKTHKMPEIARLQVDAGASGITCAKVGEAEVMVAAGFDDILIAYPIYGGAKLSRLQALREKARIIVSLDSVEVARGLGQLGTSSGDPIEIYVEVDTGLHRMGRPPGEPTARLVAQIADVEGVTVLGLMTHAGHVYGAVSSTDRDVLVDREVADLTMTSELCADAGVPIREISVGTTPSARSELRHDGVTEVRPGTYVFNDTTMMSLGVATEETCAARILATVVARPSNDRFVIDAGTKAFTSDGAGRPGWIRVVGRTDLTMSFTSEEHGVGAIDVEQGGRLAIGDKLELIPSHICPVINLFDLACAVRGDEVVGELRVASRGMVR